MNSHPGSPLPQGFTSLRVRMLLLLSGAVIAVALLSSVIYSTIIKTNLMREHRAAAGRIAERVAYIMSFSVWTFDHEQARNLAKYELREPNIQAIMLYGEDGKLLVGLARNPLRETEIAAIDDVHPFVAGDDAITATREITYHGESAGKVKIVLWNKEVDRQLKLNISGEFAQMLSLLVCLGLLAYVGLSRSLLKPLLALRQIATAYAGGDLTCLPTGLPNNEIGQLGEAMSLMARQLNATLMQTRLAAEENSALSQRLNDIIDFIPDAMFVIDTGGKVIAWNHAIEKMTGVAKEDMLGKGSPAYATPFYGEQRPLLVDLLLKEDPEVERTYENLERHGDYITGESYVNQDSRKYLWSIAAYLYDRQGERSGAIQVIRDVTLHKMEEQALRESQQSFQTIFEESPIGSTLIDIADLTYINVNRSTCELYKLAKDEMIGKSLYELGTLSGERLQQICGLFKSGKNIDRMETVVYDSAGTEHTILFSAKIISIAERGYILTLTNDITVLKKTEEQLYQSQKMDSIGRLAAGVAHDFNNMLTVIMGMAALLEAKMPKGDPLQKFVEHIILAAKRSSEITHQLLTFSRQEEIAPRPVNVNAVITELQKTLGRLIREDIALSFRPGSGIWSINLDPSQLNQILMNLAVNARDAMPLGGSLTLVTTNVTMDRQQCELCQDLTPGDYVELAVSDTGTGMDTKTIKQIFEPFFTTKEEGKGTGLGLATVYGIVKQNKGTIKVYSEPGHGTLFRIFFPRATSAACATVKEQAAAPSGSGTILLVDDEPMLVFATRNLLESIGYRVISAENPQAALRLSEDSSVAFDMVLTDVIMPGMNGREMAEKIQMVRPATRVLFMSGYTNDIVTQQGIVEKGWYFIQKPFAAAALDQKIKQILGADPGSAQL
jgi:two-component system, cell cycle sensor histidine kinase and response regulator CckA